MLAVSPIPVFDYGVYWSATSPVWDLGDRTIIVPLRTFQAPQTNYHGDGKQLYRDNAHAIENEPGRDGNGRQAGATQDFSNPAAPDGCGSFVKETVNEFGGFFVRNVLPQSDIGYFPHMAAKGALTMLAPLNYGPRVRYSHR